MIEPIVASLAAGLIAQFLERLISNEDFQNYLRYYLSTSKEKVGRLARIVSLALIFHIFDSLFHYCSYNFIVSDRQGDVSFGSSIRV